MYTKINTQSLRILEHWQFMRAFLEICLRYNVAPEILLFLYNRLKALCDEEEAALAADDASAKVKAKNSAATLRLRRNTKLFNYVKAFCSDETDPFHEQATRIMAALKEVGNVTHLPENAISTAISTIGNRLEPLATDVEAIGAKTLLDGLLSANESFIALEKECRGAVAQKGASPSDLRRELDVIYRHIISTLNALVNVNGEDPYRAMMNDVNTLVNKYDALIAAHRRGDKEAEVEENVAAPESKG